MGNVVLEHFNDKLAAVVAREEAHGRFPRNNPSPRRAVNVLLEAHISIPLVHSEKAYRTTLAVDEAFDRLLPFAK